MRTLVSGERVMVYWQETILSEQVGGSEVKVQCDKCGCEYLFLLTRIGRGAMTAPFRLATGSAARIAGQRSERDLDRRLNVEAELVPCPKCHWINDELVRGYRLTRFRRLGSAAIAIGIVGVSLSLVVGWFISIGPPGDRRALPYVLVGGPAVFLGIAVGLFIVRWALRRRIAPNRDYPREPKLPPGTPRAMFRDRATGRLVPAKSPEDDSLAEGRTLTFQIGRDTLPPRCCDCLAEARSDRGPHCRVTATINLVVPRCERCDHAASQQSLRTMTLLVMIGSALVIAGLRPWKLGAFEFWILLVLLMLVVIAFASYFAGRAATPVRAVTIDEERGVVQLRFRNADYHRFVIQHRNAIVSQGEASTHITRIK